MSLAFLVTILMTPAKASAPYKAEPGPRIISIRAMPLTGIPIQIWPRLPVNKLVMGMPLINIKVCALRLEVIPRILYLGANTWSEIPT